MPKSEAYCMDCITALKEMPDKSVSLLVADPPYGINITGRHRERERERERERRSWSEEPVARSAVCGGFGRGRPPIQRRSVSFGTSTGKKLKVESKFYPVFDDGSPPDAEVFRELDRVSQKLIIWGGNFFLDYLGAASCLIVWDKKRRGLDQADCEIAWTNLKGQSRIFEYRWNGMLQQNMKHKEERIHATQKPVDLYVYLYSLAGLKPGDLVVDPYLGSGSSRTAAYDMGFDFIGYEINETYYKLGCDQIGRHTEHETSIFLRPISPGVCTDLRDLMRKDFHRL